MCGSRGGIEGPHPLLENQKFYGFLELAFGPPAISHCKTVKVEDKKDKKRCQSCFLAVGPGPPWQKFLDPRMGQPASKLGPLSDFQQNVIWMAFHSRADNGPIVRAYWVSISFESYMYLFLDPGYVLFWCLVCFSECLLLH